MFDCNAVLTIIPPSGHCGYFDIAVAYVGFRLITLAYDVLMMFWVVQ